MSAGVSSLPVLALVGFCVAVESLQQISFKLGAGRAGRAAHLPRAAFLQPLIWLGVLLWVVESIAWVLALQRAPISQVYPVMTLTYATVPLAGLVMLRERMNRRQLAGAALIFAGVACIGAVGV